MDKKGVILLKKYIFIAKKQLVVFEYGEGGKDTELVIWKRI